MSQQSLNNYFATSWKSSLDQYTYTGWNLVEKIKPHETVIDIGCGFNEFKPFIPNLIGIDPANDKADYKVTVEEFNTSQTFDVAFCLGSINFGTEEIIKKQIECVIKLLNASGRIYWRCNPGLADHGNDECNNIVFYPWTFEKQLELANLFGFTITELKWDFDNDRRRIYAEWIKV